MVTRASNWIRNSAFTITFELPLEMIIGDPLTSVVLPWFLSIGSSFVRIAFAQFNPYILVDCRNGIGILNRGEGRSRRCTWRSQSLGHGRRKTSLSRIRVLLLFLHCREICVLRRVDLLGFRFLCINLP